MLYREANALIYSLMQQANPTGTNFINPVTDDPRTGASQYPQPVGYFMEPSESDTPGGQDLAKEIVFRIRFEDNDGISEANPDNFAEYLRKPAFTRLAHVTEVFSTNLTHFMQGSCFLAYSLTNISPSARAITPDGEQAFIPAFEFLLRLSAQTTPIQTNAIGLGGLVLYQKGTESVTVTLADAELKTLPDAFGTTDRLGGSGEVNDTVNRWQISDFAKFERQMLSITVTWQGDIPAGVKIYVANSEGDDVALSKDTAAVFGCAAGDLGLRFENQSDGDVEFTLTDFSAVVTIC